MVTKIYLSHLFIYLFIYLFKIYLHLTIKKSQNHKRIIKSNYKIYINIYIKKKSSISKTDANLCQLYKSKK